MGQHHQKGQDSTWGGLRGKLASESADVLTLPQVQDAGNKDGPFHQSWPISGMQPLPASWEANSGAEQVSMRVEHLLCLNEPSFGAKAE